MTCQFPRILRQIDVFCVFTSPCFRRKKSWFGYDLLCIALRRGLLVVCTWRADVWRPLYICHSESASSLADQDMQMIVSFEGLSLKLASMSGLWSIETERRANHTWDSLWMFLALASPHESSFGLIFTHLHGFMIGFIDAMLHDHSWPPFPSESWGCSAWLMPSRWISYYGASPPPWRSRECPRVGAYGLAQARRGFQFLHESFQIKFFASSFFFQAVFTPTTPWCGKVEGIPRNGHVNQANLGF